MSDRRLDFTGAGGSSDADARRGYRHPDDFDDRHPALAAHTGVPMPRNSRDIQYPFATHAYARQGFGMLSGGSLNTGLNSVVTSGNYQETRADNARSYGHGYDYQPHDSGRAGTRRPSFDGLSEDSRRPMVSLQIIMSKGDPFSGMPYPRRSLKPWERDAESPWYISTRYLKSCVGRSGIFGYPRQAGGGDYSFDWNKIFETVPFFIPPRFISVEGDSIRIGRRSWHSPKRFLELPDMRLCVELYVFAPWFHPEPVTKSLDLLRAYADKDGIFPGGEGLTSYVVSKPSFIRQVLMHHHDFRAESLPKVIEELNRGQFLREFFQSRLSWTTVKARDKDFVDTDAWQIIDENDRGYLRRLKELPEVAPSIRDPGELEFDISFLAIGNRVSHEFRFNHGLPEQGAADRQRRDTVRTVAQQESRLDCYLPSKTIESRFINKASARSQYIVLPDWFKRKWWYARGLVVDSVPYAHYMSEQMLRPGVRDWQIFVSEYITVKPL